MSVIKHLSEGGDDEKFPLPEIPKQQEAEDLELFKKVVYWTKEEVACYNAAIDKAIEIMQREKTIWEARTLARTAAMKYLFDDLIAKLNQLKK